jgi:hypothetical protein
MLGQHPTHRFDYLFEPLNDVGAEDVTDAASAIDRPDVERHRSETAPNRFVLAAIVLAIMAGAAVTVIVLLQQPATPGQVDAPVDSVRVATTEPQAPSQPVLVVPPIETDIGLPEVTATVEPQPPEPEPSAAGGEPDVHDRPTTRAPISVEPTQRQLFPNQGPRGDGGRTPSSQPGVSGSPSPSHGRGHGQHE